ncbi:hypothetical protein CEP51_013589 [Fusarium floridanum]|uniref:Uncharacterized protein n=1 Tax=Fusarium floridanum TaxID=1325733 RepID=A0A428Q8U8_9HYPO|nr:hypothetical protein CEP51_013589 [Fusarium floridanum]
MSIQVFSACCSDIENDVARRNGAEEYDRDRRRSIAFFPGSPWVRPEFICDGSAPESYDEVKVGRVYL